MKNIVSFVLIAGLVAAPAIATAGAGRSNNSETSDRTPDKKSVTPPEQVDSYDGKTSDRTPDNVTAKLSKSECEKIWNDQDGVALTSDKAGSLVTDFKALDADGDGKLSNAEFTSGCDKGMIKSGAATTGAGTGSSGSSTVPKTKP